MLGHGKGKLGDKLEISSLLLTSLGVAAVEVKRNEQIRATLRREN